MQRNNLLQYTIEVDIDKYLCNVDEIQEISFEFVKSNHLQQNPTNDEQNNYERIIDIDLNELGHQNGKFSNEINAVINGQDTIIKTTNICNPEDEIDILQMDEEHLFEDSTKTPISLVEQNSSQSFMEI